MLFRRRPPCIRGSVHSFLETMSMLRCGIHVVNMRRRRTWLCLVSSTAKKNKSKKGMHCEVLTHMQNKFNPYMTAMTTMQITMVFSGAYSLASMVGAWVALDRGEISTHGLRGDALIVLSRLHVPVRTRLVPAPGKSSDVFGEPGTFSRPERAKRFRWLMN